MLCARIGFLSTQQLWQQSPQWVSPMIVLWHQAPSREPSYLWSFNVQICWACTATVGASARNFVQTSRHIAAQIPHLAMSLLPCQLLVLISTVQIPPRPHMHLYGLRPVEEPYFRCLASPQVKFDSLESIGTNSLMPTSGILAIEVTCSLWRQNHQYHYWMHQLFPLSSKQEQPFTSSIR